MSVREAVQRGLTALCTQVMREPFGILREAGLQAELRTLLIKQPELRKRVPVKIIAHDSMPQGRFVWSAKLLRRPLLRVQLEMKILEGSPKERKFEDRMRTDVVVLKDSNNSPQLPTGAVRLKCYPNGPGDIVASLCQQDVAAAIEIKASPSIDKGQCFLYGKDISRLLDLAHREAGLCAFFCVIDKSQSLFGEAPAGIRKHRSPVNWQDRAEVQACLGLSRRRMRLVADRPTKGPYVEIWSVSRGEANLVLFAEKMSKSR